MCARPAKSVSTMSKNLTKAEKEKRTKGEEKLKGDSNNIKAPPYLNKKQKLLFDYIVAELKASGILSNLDIYILCTCSIAIDRLEQIETKINKSMDCLWDKDLMSAKDKYTKDLYRCCNELSLSPQSRAKIANINLQPKKEEDPLLKALSEDD